MKSPIAIHQFHSGSGYGDAITNSMFIIRKILREAGFKSDIYVEHIAIEFQDELISYKNYKSTFNQVLIIHHSMGHDLDEWITSLKDRIILVYHNITPSKFFPEGSLVYHYAQKGREQLKNFKNLVHGAIAVSEFNESELRTLGYKETITIPLLLDTQSIKSHPWNKQLYDKLKSEKCFNILFVGRIVENKCQHDLIEIIKILNDLGHRKSKLYLVGGITSNSYFENLKKLISEYNLNQHVIFTGKVIYEDLYAYYRAADIFLCMSEHEGFCVPLVEAMLFDVPVIAYDSPESNIRNTLNDGGFLFKEKNYEEIAGLICLLQENRRLRRYILKQQRKALKIYDFQNIKFRFLKFLKSLGIEVKIEEESFNYTKPSVKIQIEGPFDSSYSLALLNREMALTLNKLYPDQVSLYSTEGPGDFKPNNKFLNSHPVIKKMWEISEKALSVDMVLRNLYPPRVHDMKGLINAMNIYGWEESVFPREYIEDFNVYLDILPVMSNYVKKVMIDNGIQIPVEVIGDGVDHILKIQAKKYNGYLGKGFKFLYVSSAFPRKGVDILLKAYVNSFTNKDNVSLIVKTFPNIHNNIKEQLEVIKKDYPDCPEIILINEDLPYEYIVDLYHKCDCFVAPTRGEGFGLTIAEAMLLGLPVIVTGYGGQSDFCNEDSCWLIDYEFKNAKTHFKLFNSVWVEPKVEHLAKLMKMIVNLPRKEIEKKTRKAKQFILKQYKWEDCGKRLIKAIQKIEKQPIFYERKIKLGWISSWNCKCGIAQYSKYLLENFDEYDFDITIFANITDHIIHKDDSKVIRCWKDTSQKDLNPLITKIIQNDIEALVIQYNFGFFEIYSFGKMIDLLKKRGIKIFITFHSTADVNKPDFRASLSWIKDSLIKVDRIFVHSINDLNRLKNIGLIENVTLLPHGVFYRKKRDIKEVKSKIGLSNKRIIASYGFLLPNKGIKELIQAFYRLSGNNLNLYLLLINSLYPNLISEQYKDECLKLVTNLNLSNKVLMINDFLDEEESIILLEAADIIIFPYQYTQESASGAVRFGLSSYRPVACTPLEIFNDVEEVVHFLPGFTPEKIANGITDLFNNPNLLLKKGEIQERWLKEHSWFNIAKRLSDIIKYFCFFGM